MRIVFDTNVLVAAHASPGLCRELVGSCHGRHELVTSGEMLDELLECLTGKLGVAEAEAKIIVEGYLRRSRLVTPEAVPASACRDPDDCVVLGTAVAGGADVIVSGDQDLVSLGSFRGIPIITPRGCFERLRSRGPGGAGLVAERRPRWRRVRPRTMLVRRRARPTKRKG